MADSSFLARSFLVPPLSFVCVCAPEPEAGGHTHTHTRFVSFRFVGFDAGRPLLRGTSFWGFRTNVPTQWLPHDENNQLTSCCREGSARLLTGSIPERGRPNGPGVRHHHASGVARLLQSRAGPL